MRQRLRGTNIRCYRQKKCTNLIYNEEYAESEEEWENGIFNLLLDEMQIILFPDFLKRYIYRKLSTDRKFEDFTDEEYQEIIKYSFKERGASYSFSETKKRPSAFVKEWMADKSVTRKTVFLLGFGLNMETQDVSDFLVKALKENDFNFSDPFETICWISYRFHTRYQKAMEWWKYYETLNPWDGKLLPKTMDWKSITEQDSFEEHWDVYLKEYLLWLKLQEAKGNIGSVPYNYFMELYRESKQVIADNMNLTDSEGDTQTTTEISDFQVEQELYCGVPKKNGNMQRMEESLLAEVFRNYRIGRKRFSDLKKKKIKVSRFDLITLKFFVYCQRETKENYYSGFVKEMNDILKECGMHELYPVNPYETFILLCLVNPDPLQIFSDIWMRSYEQEE